MKRASYRDACDWIAFNDSWGDVDSRDIEVVSGLVTVVLIADIFGVKRERVAADVIKIRKRADKKEWP